MIELNPLASTILGGLQQQRAIGVDKSRQLRRSRIMEDQVETQDDQLEHEVETSDALTAIRDQSEQPPPKQEKGKKPADDKPHIDIRG
jgi:hypothetical protein